MSKEINIGLITIGNGDWKKVLSNIWNSLTIIEDNKYRIMRNNDEYNAKMVMDIKDLPCYMTNYDLHLDNGYTIRVVIGMPYESGYIDNDKIVGLPWYDEEYSYKKASEICCEKIVCAEYANCVVVLCGENLTEEEMITRSWIADLCSLNDKRFMEIGNDCECMSISYLIKWFESGENYCSYFEGRKAVGIQ